MKTTGFTGFMQERTKREEKQPNPLADGKMFIYAEPGETVVLDSGSWFSSILNWPTNKTNFIIKENLMQTESDMGRFHGDEGKNWPTLKEEREAEDKLGSDVLNYITEHQNGPALELLQTMQIKFGLSPKRIGEFLEMWYAGI